MGPKIMVIVALAVVSFASGVIDQYFYPDQNTPPSGFVAAIVFALLIFAWYRLDSIQRGYKRSPLLNVGIALLSLVALPIYFFRSRGLKGGLIACALAFVSLVGFSLLGAAGQYVVYGLQS